MQTSRLPMVFLAASLAACYAQVEDSAVQVTHSLCNPPTSACIPGGGVTPISAFNSTGGNTFSVNFGNVPLLKSSDTIGPATLHTTLTLNSASFDMVTPGTGADFSGIQTVQLLSAPSGAPAGTDPCPSPTSCPVIAIYDRAVDGMPDPRKLTLRNKAANLVDLIDASHTLTIEVKATGSAPAAPFWNADLTMDLGMKSRVDYP